MGMFDWVEWEGRQYQTKDTPRQFCDNYRIDENGVLWVEEYDAEWVQDSNHVFGAYIDQKNRRWRPCEEFSGKMRFYRENRERGGWNTNAWTEFEAEFIRGLMIDLKLIEGEQFIQWYKQGIRERGLE